MRGFRLLRAAGHFARSTHQHRSPGTALEYTALEVEFAPPTASPTESWVSVVIGRNGVGKSRLLAGIAELFHRLDGGGHRPSRETTPLIEVDYLIDGKKCRAELNENGRLVVHVDETAGASKTPLPQKVIALTTTPFDKFRIVPIYSNPFESDHSMEPGLYSYLGLRDRTGRASTTAAIFRALEGLFEASNSSQQRKQKIAEVFEFLGYTPRIEVFYRRSAISSLLEGVADGVNLEKILPPSKLNSPFFVRLQSNKDEYYAFQRAAQEIIERMVQGRISLRADFLHDSEDEQLFKKIQPLRKAGLLRMAAVEVERLADGTVLDLRMASSGELGIVTGFLGLASVIEDNSLIFIDEPEISLHPEWQTNYIELLTKTFSHFTGCHFVLATHSPLILSDVNPEASNIVSLDPERRNAENSDAYAGKSYDFVLATAFNEPGNNNLYLKEIIVKALRLVADGKISTPEFKKSLTILVENLPKLKQESPVAKLIREIQATHEVERNS